MSDIKIDNIWKKAFELTRKGKNLFITGKAGTGKTTLLKEVVSRLKEENKMVAVTAPTGVAAHNAEGVTLHSLLRLPLNPYLPGIKIPKLYSLNDDERRVVRNLDVLIIDEVSMVRCDMMDAADDILRHYRSSKEPFGGVQIVMFGDLYQLMPVAVEEDEKELTKYYKSFYFFGSNVMKKLDYSMLELKTIYRQDDRSFVNLLNTIREGTLSLAEQNKLDQLYRPKYKEPKGSHQIIITTHNWKSRWLNQKKLDAMSKREREYKAYIDGYFPRPEYPTNYNLRLKVGARVMFLRNMDGIYYNGMLGTIVSLSDHNIVVKTDNDGREIDVEKDRWDFERYHLNKKTKELEIEKIGSFVQYPLKLAWAITIHKSQGLTFENVVIDAGKAFAAGQVYVALSRCRQFNKIVLMSKITPKVVKIDPSVEQYLKSVKREKVIATSIKKATKRVKIKDTIRKTLTSLQEGLSPEEIAKARGLVLGTIYSHLTELVGLGEINVLDLVSKEDVELVKLAWEKAESDKLSEIKMNLPPEVSYETIKVVMAHLKREEELKKS